MCTALLMIAWVANTPDECFASDVHIMKKHANDPVIRRFRSALESYNAVASKFKARGVDPVDGKENEALTAYAGSVVMSVHSVDRWIAQYRLRLIAASFPAPAVGVRVR